MSSSKQNFVIVTVSENLPKSESESIVNNRKMTEDRIEEMPLEKSSD